MKLDRLTGTTCGQPFPVYEDLVERLLAAHRADEDGRDATVAHVLGTCAAYACVDIETFTTIMARLGLEDSACVRIAQTVDSMLIYSTAYLVQSRCGRVAILCYRGTDTTNIGNWLGDVDVGLDTMTLGGETFGVHAGFYRNVRATRLTVIDELHLALQGRSLLDPDKSVEQPLQALYVTGHSLGGAMAALFSLSVVGTVEQRPIADRLRAVYTFGQPMAVGGPLPDAARALEPKLFRHITARDIVPTLPAASWGPFVHFGREYRYTEGQWQYAETAVAQLAHTREIPRSVLAVFASAKRRGSSRYTVAEHGAQQYLAALRPKGRVTEFGDHD
jgi:hypothetical protein